VPALAEVEFGADDRLAGRYRLVEPIGMQQRIATGLAALHERLVEGKPCPAAGSATSRAGSATAAGLLAGA
jgi:hypothetical protein